MGGSASEEFLVPAPSGEDTFVQCTNCDYAANTEAVEIAAPDPADPADHPPPEVLDTPDTPTIDTLVARMNELGPPDHRGRHAEERRAARRRRRATTTGRCWSSACPATARSTSSGSAGQLEPIVVEQAGPEDLAKVPGLVKGYIGPQVLRRAEGALPRRPARRRGDRVGDRRERARASTPHTSCAVATSSRTASSARSRSATATGARGAGRRSRSRAASRWATCSSSARSTPRPSG